MTLVRVVKTKTNKQKKTMLKVIYRKEYLFRSGISKTEISIELNLSTKEPVALMLMSA